MSLFQSLDTSAGGMMAYSKATSIVSTNIANMTTTGYKKSEAAFYDLVTTSRYSPGYEPGGVRVNRVLRADQQGSVQQTVSATEAAITGNGFFVVARTPDTISDSTSQPSNLFFTRNGSFGEISVPDVSTGTETTYLSNAAGLFLYGWQYDETGALPAAQDFSSLQAIDISRYDTIPIPTTQLSFSLNLKADVENIDMHFSSGGAAQLPATSEPASFSRSFTVYDQNGDPQQLTMEFRKIVGPMAHFSTQSGRDAELSDAFIPTIGTGYYDGISAGDSFTVDVNGVVETYTFVDEALGDDIATNQIATMQGLISALNDHGVDALALPPVTEGALSAQIEDGRLLVRAKDPTVTIILAETSGTPLSGPQTLGVVQDPDTPADFEFEPDEDITNPVIYPDQGDFPTIADTTSPVPQNWWELTIVNPTTGATIRQGLLNFDGNGALNAVADANGDYTIDLSTTPIDFDGDPNTPGDSITIDISRISQFAGDFYVGSSSQNGAGLGTRTGLEITADGRVVGTFGNGVRANLYQIPLASFANANGLNDKSGTIFSITEASGDPVLGLVGQGANGVLRPSAIEGSNVDIADEFAHLIVSQRGFTLNSQVIQTIDQMAEKLGQL
ncbi:MAG: flagellar hook-basal body complex protein [Rhodospirillales bacterium]|nr:flagellar hook-basal body complex protein [Rhodospirillales bacterium]